MEGKGPELRKHSTNTFCGHGTLKAREVTGLGQPFPWLSCVVGVISSPREPGAEEPRGVRQGHRYNAQLQ